MGLRFPTNRVGGKAVGWLLGSKRVCRAYHELILIQELESSSKAGAVAPSEVRMKFEYERPSRRIVGLLNIACKGKERETSSLIPFTSVRGPYPSLVHSLGFRKHVLVRVLVRAPLECGFLGSRGGLLRMIYMFIAVFRLPSIRASSEKPREFLIQGH